MAEPTQEKVLTGEESRIVERRPIPPVYANNALFEASIWDLRILFGQIDKAISGEGMVDWRVAVTLPWAQAKLICYFLRMNIALRESSHGAIQIPANMIPKLVPPEGDDPLYPTAVRMHRELFGPEQSDSSS